MAKADHLYVSHGVYTHHGIDLGDGTVAHLSRACGRVSRDTLADFASGREVRVMRCQQTDPPDVVVARAVACVGKLQYSLFHGNCEHFASWCQTGQAQSRQVDRVRTKLAAVSSRAMTRHLTKGVASLTGKAALKGLNPALLVVDVAQLGTELLMHHRGHDPDKAADLGTRVGLVGSVAVGAAVAGPVGACVSLGVWAAGEFLGRRASKLTPPSTPPANF